MKPILNSRTTDILRAAVAEFIRTGEPVGSERLYQNYDFGIKPAMIRLELNDLADKGYLEQPHHAAGRVPSDKGYAFFANEVLQAAESKISDNLMRLFEERAWAAFLGEMSEDLGVLGIAATGRGRTVHKGLLEYLIDNLEWNSREEIRSVIRDFEELDARIDRFWQETGAANFLRVFVGRESPITDSSALAVLAADYRLDGERIMLCAIGPKRMDYRKTTGVLKGLQSKRSNMK